MHPDIQAASAQSIEPTDNHRAERTVREAFERHLNSTLDLLRSELQKPESPERRAAIEGIAIGYTIGFLEAMILDDARFETLLIRKGARKEAHDADERWNFGSPLLTYLSERVAESIPTRLATLEQGRYRDPARQRTDRQVFNDGVRRILRDLVENF